MFPLLLERVRVRFSPLGTEHYSHHECPLASARVQALPATAIWTTPEGRRKQCVISFLLLRFLFLFRNKEKKMKNYLNKKKKKKNTILLLWDDPSPAFVRFTKLTYDCSLSRWRGLGWGLSPQGKFFKTIFHFQFSIHPIRPTSSSTPSQIPLPLNFSKSFLFIIIIIFN